MSNKACLLDWVEMGRLLTGSEEKKLLNRLARESAPTKVG